MYARDPGQTTATCRERYAYDNSGLNGRPTSAALDSPIFGQIDSTGDGTFERSFQIVQGNSGDVLKIIEPGKVDEEIRYSLWGEPRIVTWFADINHDGAVDGEDAAGFFALWDNGDGLADVNGDSGIDGDDVILFFEWWDAGQGSGLTLADNRFGFRGYVWDDHLKLYHVRHRVYDPTTSPSGMRWLQRDPAFFVDGWNLYGYCGGDPVNGFDPMGLDSYIAGDILRSIGADSLGDFVDDSADGVAELIDMGNGEQAAGDAQYTNTVVNLAHGAQQAMDQAVEDGRMTPEERDRKLRTYITILAGSIDQLHELRNYEAGRYTDTVVYSAAAAGSVFLAPVIGKAAGLAGRGAIGIATRMFGANAVRSVAASVMIRAGVMQYGVNTVLMRSSGALAGQAAARFATKESATLATREGLCAGVETAAEDVELGRKLDFPLGKATGSAHNVERSQAMLAQLERIGLPDTPETRSVLAEHFALVYRQEGKVQGNGRVLRESLLMGPRGGLRVETVWEGNRLITIMLYGGR